MVHENESGGVIVSLDRQPFTAYVIDQRNKPFLWPVIGLDGKEMTRAYPIKKVLGEATDHIHHRGICFVH